MRLAFFLQPSTHGAVCPMHQKQVSSGLMDLARANEQKRDAALLRATTELFVLDVIHERDEIHRYEELAIHFLPKVGPEDRTFVAERLAIAGDAPLSVVRTLARDIIAVAAPILKHSPVLRSIDLLSIIGATGPEHHRLIARRAGLSPEVKRALRLTGDSAVAARLDAIEPQAAADPRITDAGVEAVAAAIMPPAASSQPAAIYYSNRLDPWRFLSLDRKARLKLIAEIAARPPALPYTGNATRLDRAFRSILSAAQIVGYARGGQLGPIVAAVAEGLGLPAHLVTTAIADKSGELFAVMLKALRLDDTQARQVFLLASPSGRDVQAFFPLSDLYAGMEPEVAEMLVEAWREAAYPAEAGHEPFMADNSTRPRPALGEIARPTRTATEEKSKRA